MALRRLALISTCVLILFNAANAQAEGSITWTLTNGPTGGSVNVLLSVSGVADLIFAGTNGGVYQTRDQGLHWRLASDGLPDDRVITGLAGSPDGSVAFAGTRQGVFRSRDLGATWTPVLADQSVLSLLVDPRNPILVYAGTVTSFFRSENGGDSWTDLGQTLKTAPVWSVALATDASALYVSTDSGIYASRDRGDHWLRAFDGLPDGTRVLSIVSSSRGLYATTARGLFKSYDGKTFSVVNGAYGMPIHSVVADPFSPDRMFAATAQGLVLSKDGGASFAEVATAPTAAPIFSLAIDSSAHLLIGSARGVWRTADDGTTWQSLNDGLVSAEVSSLAAGADGQDTLFAVTRYGLSFSRDQGSSWTEAKGISNPYSLAVASDSGGSSIVYAGTWDGSVFISRDGGSSFSILKENVARNAPIGCLYVLHPTPSSTTLIAGTVGNGVWRSNDGGETWFDQSLGLGNTARVLVLASNSASTLYAGTERGLYVLDASNVSAAWKVASTELPTDAVRAIVVDPKPPESVLVAFASNGLYRSDPVVKWRPVGRGVFPTRIRFQSVARNPVHSGVIYVGTDRGFYRTDDEGVSWVAANSGMPPGADVLAIAVNAQAPHQLFIGTRSNGVIAGTDPFPFIPPPWLPAALGGVAALLIVGVVATVWRTRFGPVARARAWARQWPEWEQMIAHALWTFGQVTQPSVHKIPPQHLLHALEYYIDEHPQDALTLETDPPTLKLDNYLAAQKILSRWKAAWEIDGDVSALSPITSQMVDQFCNLLGFARVQERSYKGLIGYVVRAPSLRLRIPPRFPIVFIPHHEVGEQDLSALRDLMSVLSMTSYFALIVDLRDWPDPNEQQSLKRLVRKDVHDFIVLDGHDLRSLLAARDHPRRLVQIILDQVDLSVISPYVTSGPVPENMFFGREQEIKTIMRKIRETNYAIIGGRKIGKTSVLARVHRLMQHAPEFMPFYLDCQAAHNERDFFEAVDALWHSPLPSPTPEGFRRMALDTITQYPNRTIVMLFDEVDALLFRDIAQGERLFRILRALSQENQIRFVFCGEKTLNAALRNPKLSLFNFCNVLYLTYLSPEEARRVITEPMQELGIALEGGDALADYAVEMTTGHPNIVQFVCQKLIERINARHERMITRADVDAVIQSMQFAEYFAAISWGNAKPLERLVTLLMLDRPEVTLGEMADLLRARNAAASPVAVENAFDGLCLYSILRRDGPKYAFAAPALPRILRRSQDVSGLVASLLKQISAVKGAQG